MGIVEQRLARTFKHDLPCFQHICPVCDSKGLIDVLIDNKYRSPFRTYPVYNIEYFPDEDWSKAKRRLVKHHKKRFCHQPPADRDHLLLPAAERAAELFSPLFQAWEKLKDHLPGLLALFPGFPLKRAHIQVLLNRHLYKKPPRLRNVDQAVFDEPEGLCFVDRFSV